MLPTQSFRRGTSRTPRMLGSRSVWLWTSMPASSVRCLPACGARNRPSARRHCRCSYRPESGGPYPTKQYWPARLGAPRPLTLPPGRLPYLRVTCRLPLRRPPSAPATSTGPTCYGGRERSWPSSSGTTRSPTSWASPTSHGTLATPPATCCAGSGKSGTTPNCGGGSRGRPPR